MSILALALALVAPPHAPQVFTVEGSCDVALSLADGSKLTGSQAFGNLGPSPAADFEWSSMLADQGFAVVVNWSRVEAGSGLGDALVYFTFHLMAPDDTTKLRLQIQREDSEKGMVLAGDYRVANDGRIFAFTDWGTLRALGTRTPALLLQVSDEAESVATEERITPDTFDMVEAGIAQARTALAEKLAGDRKTCMHLDD